MASKTSGKCQKKIEFKRPDNSEMAPLGYHMVRGHLRICESGTKTWVDEHLRKNKGRKPKLLKENLLHLYWNSKTRYPQLCSMSDYPKGDDYDDLIQFWFDYWKSQGIEFPDDLTPDMVKALIAVESSFSSESEPPEANSSAAGLMQVTNQAMNIMDGYSKDGKWFEMKDNLISVTECDKFDPVVNIAMGTRWLGHKYSQIPKRYHKNAKSTLIGYHSFDKAGEAYANKVLSELKKACKI
ncbi:MAG: transglycosylase SLT domain-containing protein [Bacteroidales bacterium]|jgi:hypothetical protein|nr:transglycosylase SLT domain-containing protein [Bacteroidales bacterium]